MASANERRENGDGSYSINVALTDSDGILQVAVVSNSVTLTGHNAVSIRDVNNNEVVVDVAKMPGEKAVVITSTLSHSADISLFAEGAAYTYALLGVAKNVAGSSSLIITTSDYAGLKASFSKLRIRVKATTAPTSGSINTYVEGVQV